MIHWKRELLAAGMVLAAGNAAGDEPSLKTTTVGAWREFATTLGGARDAYAFGFATGSLAGVSMFFQCPEVVQGRDLQVYLERKAAAKELVGAAVFSFLLFHGCKFDRAVAEGLLRIAPAQ